MTNNLASDRGGIELPPPKGLSSQMMEASDRLVTAALAAAAVQAALAGGELSRAAALEALQLELARLDFMIEGESERDNLTALTTARRLLEQYLDL